MAGFVEFPAKYNNLPNDGSVLSDVANHCQKYSYYRSPNSKTTSAHECTHGVNADLRNGAIQMGLIIDQPGRIRCPLPMATADGVVRGGTNAFYALRDQAIRIAEPNCRKSDAVKYIPKAFQFSRYSTYVTGQREWDDSPLYLFDEWTAYCNGTECGIVDNCGSKDTDEIFGPIEFVAYCTGVMMAAKATNSLNEDMIFYSNHTLKRSFDLYEKGKDKYPWDQADKVYGMLKTGSEGKDFRDFWLANIGFDPNNATPTPKPDELDFYV